MRTNIDIDDALMAEAMQVTGAGTKKAVVPMMNTDLGVLAATHYRILRAAGVTIRKTVHLIIGTFCIDRGYRLLHNDRDFEPMHDLLGLQRA